MPRLARGLGKQKFGIGQVVPAKTVTITEVIPVDQASVTYTGQTVTVADTGGGDANVAAWVAAVNSAGGSVSAARQALVETLVAGLKADGIWSKLDRLWLFSAENTQSALIDLVAASAATAVNSPTFTVDNGYTFASTKYIDTGWKPNTGVNYTLNSAHYGAWVKVRDATDVAEVAGVIDGGGKTQLYWLSTPAWVGNITDGGGGVYTTTFGGGPGHIIVNRSAFNAVQMYGNGGSSDTGTDISGTLQNRNFFVGARNDNGSPNLFSQHQISAFHTGGSLNSTEAGNLYTRLNTYMATVAWEAAVIAAGGTVSAARQSLISDLIYGLTADGIWSKLDRLWLFKAENSQSALIDLVATAAATAVNTPTFTVDQGYAGNGSSSYVDSNYPANTGGHYIQDSACLFAWNNTDLTASTDSGGIAGAFGSGSTRFLPKYIDNKCYWNVNGGSGFKNFTNSGATGLYLMNRSGASAATMDINGTQVDSDSGASSATVSGKFVALYGVDGTTFYHGQCSCLGFGEQLSGGERSALYTRLNTYMVGGPPPTDTITVTQASVTFTGQTVIIRDAEVVPVLKASVTVSGQTVTIRDLTLIPVLKASVTYTGKTVTILDRDVVPVLKASVTFTGKAVGLTETGFESIAVDPATVTFTGKTINIVDLAADVIPIGKGDILFVGQPIIITDTGVQPPVIGLPGGGAGFYVPPWRDLDRKKRRRYRALEEIEQRLDARIERLTAESKVTQEQVAAVAQIGGQTGQFVSQQYEDLLRRQAQVTQMLHEAQRRAEAVRQEKIELARLARIAFEAADEEEAIFALLF